MAEEGLLGRLVITEEGDVTESVIDRGAASSSLVTVQSCGGESALKKEEEHTGEDKNEEVIASKMCLEEQSPERQQTNAEDEQTGEVFMTEEDKPENVNDGQNRGEGQTREMMRIKEKPEKPSDTEVTQNDPQVDFKRLNSSEGTNNEEEDPKKVVVLLWLCHIP